MASTEQDTDMVKNQSHLTKLDVQAFTKIYRRKACRETNSSVSLGHSTNDYMGLGCA